MQTKCEEPLLVTPRILILAWLSRAMWATRAMQAMLISPKFCTAFYPQHFHALYSSSNDDTDKNPNANDGNDQAFIVSDIDRDGYALWSDIR